jgi:hypothetical protein
MGISQLAPALRVLIAGLGLAAVLGALPFASAAPARADTTDSQPTDSQPAAARTSFPLRVDDFGPYVGVVHKRLHWLGYRISESEASAMEFGPTTLAALHSFQEKFSLRRTNTVSTGVWDNLKKLAGPVGTLPRACMGVDTICIGTAQKVVRWVSAGRVLLTTDARFGIPGNETMTGTFTVTHKSRDHVSSLYRTSMPFALFFKGGQAVHYSPYFHRDGYFGGSHGCVNLRDYAKAKWLFEHSRVGTRVHIGT